MDRGKKGKSCGEHAETPDTPSTAVLFWLSPPPQEHEVLAKVIECCSTGCLPPRSLVESEQFVQSLGDQVAANCKITSDRYSA